MKSPEVVADRIPDKKPSPQKAHIPPRSAVRNGNIGHFLQACTEKLDLATKDRAIQPQSWW